MEGQGQSIIAKIGDRHVGPFDTQDELDRYTQRLNDSVSLDETPEPMELWAPDFAEEKLRSGDWTPATA